MTITFAGYQYDSITDLYYLNARMYDPKIARFMQEDTYSGEKNDPLSLNLYTYCHNEPIMYTDPTGHWGTVVHGDKTDKKGNIIEDKNGNPVIDTKKTKDERKKCVNEQT